MMIRPAVLTTLVLAAASTSFAADPIPVVDASPGITRQADDRQFQGNLAVNQQGTQLAEMLYQQQLLQQEVQQLRGIVEQQAYEIKRMREEQRDRYLDLDRRITLLNQAPVKAVTSPVSADEPAPIVEPEKVVADTPKEPVIDTAKTAPATEKKLSEKEAYKQAFSLVRNKQYAEAITGFELLIRDYPEGNYTGNAYYWLGEVLLVEAKQQQALNAFETLLEKYPHHRKAPDAKFKQGKIYLQMGDKTRAKVLLQDVVDQHSGSSAAKLAEAEIRDAQL